LRNTILMIVLAFGLCSSLSADEPKPVELTIHARAIESPQLKYRLLPSEAELKPGNAVPILLRLPWEQTAYFNTTFGTLEEWDSRPLTAPEWKDFRGVMPFYDEMKRAAFRREASWEYPIGEEPAYFIGLPDMQGLRGLLGFGLSAKIRYSLLQGELSEAREGILVGLANGRHLAQTPFFVNQIVAAVIHRSMLDRTADLIAQPNSPNLYWALSTLPDSLVELHRAASLEASMFGMTFPAANDLDRPREAAEWKKMLDQLFELFDQFGDTPSHNPQEAEAHRADLIQAARAELAQLLQLPTAKVAAMSDEEAAVRWYVHIRANLDQRASAALCLKPSEAWPRLKEYDGEVETIQKKCKTGTFDFFKPTPQYLSAWSLKRQVEALRIIEAVRHYLATHEGKLPASLADIETLSIPRDPLTDEAFEWKVDGNTATLKALFLPCEPKMDGSYEHRISFRLRVAMK
jgi:hypothetical protein